MSAITFEGKPLHLFGVLVREGDVAPEFTVVDKDLQLKTLDDFGSKIKIFTTFPSLDTPVCQLQLKEFNKRATDLADNIVIVAVSKDLPFAQTRFCFTEGIDDRIAVLSDYQESSFAHAYGLQIQELHLLARSIIIVDDNNTVRYVQLVSEITHEPNYNNAFTALERIVKG